MFLSRIANYAIAMKEYDTIKRLARGQLPEQIQLLLLKGKANA
jgi:hypothetical protein